MSSLSCSSVVSPSFVDGAGDGEAEPEGGWTVTVSTPMVLVADELLSIVEEVTGSAGSAGVSSGWWRPSGLRGSRRVPLLGRGVMPTESQRML